MATGKLRNLLEGLKPAMTMVIVQIIFGGLNIMYKLARNDGMSMKILVAYRNIFATAIMVPLALIFEGKSRPKLTWMIFLQGSLCGLFGGSLGQNLYAESLSLTSATFVAAMTNLVPAMTFVMAVFLRMERLAIGTIAGKAKLMGTIMSLGGAMILTFYKGVEIKLWSTNINLLHHGAAALQESSPNQVLGSLLAVASCVCIAVWLIVQTKMSMVYPSYSGTALMCVCASIQSVVYAMCTERDWSAWKLGWDIRLLTVVYSGVLASGLMVTLMTWVSRMRGPLFVSSFFPLMLVTVAILGSLLLHEQLHIGSIIAAVLIIVGLYIVLWGKGKEMKQTAQIHAAQSFSEQDLRHIVIENSSNSECKPEASGIIGPIEPADLGSGVPSAAAVVNK
ncbi:unnamed protein product, partial [Vitis vinifera]|uniref:WAT1-related protein n=1 Tax=Vitis vinifera TaxID=29760 RepID=D7U439_VITVI